MKRRFYVGCRVKIIKSDSYPHFVGLHATIVGPAGNGDDWGLAIDDTPPPPPYPHWTHTEPNLEPIWPGSEKTTWAACMWKPVPLGKRKLETA